MQTKSASLRVHALPAFSDNYIWLIQSGMAAVVVDPGDALVVNHFLQQHQLSLQAILLTHHHADHTGGAAALQQQSGCAIYAPVSEHAAYANLQATRVSAMPSLALPGFADIPCSVYALPGHTLDHIAYLIDNRHLFSGDVLFGAGCGRLFEGSPAQMFDSLQKIKQLPVDTLIYPAHEYTAHNIAFALQVDPHNRALQQRQIATTALRQAGQPSLPTSLTQELATNPFLRCEALLESTPTLGQDALAVFTTLRSMRNTF